MPHLNSCIRATAVCCEPAVKSQAVESIDRGGRDLRSHCLSHGSNLEPFRCSSSSSNARWGVTMHIDISQQASPHTPHTEEEKAAEENKQVGIRIKTRHITLIHLERCQ